MSAFGRTLGVLLAPIVLLVHPAPILGQSGSADAPPWHQRSDVFDGGPVATRNFDGDLIVLPGSRGPGDPGFEPIDGEGGGLPGSEIAILSWNFLMAAFGSASVGVGGPQPTSIEFGGGESVWLPEPETLDGCLDEDGVSMCWHWPFVVDPRGNFSGSGTFEVSGATGGLVVDGMLDGALWGRMRRWVRAQDTWVTLRLRLAGELSIGGLRVPTRLWVRFQGRITPDGTRCDPSSMEACFFGELRTWMRMNPPGLRPIRSASFVPFAEELPREDGVWSLDMMVLQDGRVLDGNATALFGPPEAREGMIAMDVGGRHLPWRDVSRLWMRPVATGLWGNRISMWGVESTEGAIESGHVFYSLFGQRGRTEISDDTCCAPSTSSADRGLTLTR